MSLFQFIICLACLIFLIAGYDLYKRKGLNLIHWIIFVGGLAVMSLFAYSPAYLDMFGRFFGVARGADLLVYISIIIYGYGFFEIINKLNKQDIHQTDIIRLIALHHTRGSLGDSTIVCIIPAYNEEEIAVQTVKQLLDAGYGVVYIDDGSPRISQVATLQQSFLGRNLVIIEHTINLGQGAALQTGSVYIQKNPGQTQFVVHFDSDGQMQMSDIPTFVQAFTDNPHLDIVLGSRYLGTSDNMPRNRKIMKKGARLFMWMMVGLSLTDTHNGFRVMRLSTLPKIHITLNRMAHASEIEHLIDTNHLTYTEVPVHILYTDYSLAKGQQISGMRKVLKDFLWKLILR